jgi:hypothetical protein
MIESQYSKISKCRISESQSLLTILDLGTQSLTGVFPRSASEPVSMGPLELVWCPQSGLVQLRHSFHPAEMYGENYGYRSGLNQSMVDHLTSKVRALEREVKLNDNDTVLDIGSNDGTLLGAYENKSLIRIGIDPTGEKFRSFYNQGIKLIPDFFSAENFFSNGGKRAKIVTSISMFYDLEDPIKFAREVESVLADDGIWHLEQSYMPSMLRTNSYDTICHEHLEYYSLRTLLYILDRSHLKVLNVVMNSVNGGSFAVTVSKSSFKGRPTSQATIDWILEQEERMGLATPAPYRNFEERVFRHREDLTRLIRSLNAEGKRILGYGASTKGNVLLQFCGLTPRDLEAIAEVNPEKFGRVTPGTHIPIISEEEARAMRPDYLLVLPWHFKSGILKRESEFLKRGGQIIFPFPEIEIV